MKRIVPKKIEQYCQEHSNPESQLLHELVAETFAHTAFPEMEVGHLGGGISTNACEITSSKTNP